MSDESTYEPDEADLAAEEGRWVDALGFKLAAIKAHAIGLLEGAEAFAPEALAKIGPLLADMVEPRDKAHLEKHGKWPAAALDELPLSGLEAAALLFMEKRPEPSPKDPLPALPAAAMFVMELSAFVELLGVVGKSMSERRFSQLCELLWISGHLGMLSESFRAELGGFAHHLDAAARRKAGGQRGAAKTAANADAWRVEGLKIAIAMRTKKPKTSAADIRRAIRKNVAGSPEDRGVERQITKWVVGGRLKPRA